MRSFPIFIILGLACLAACKEKQDLQGAAITALRGEVRITNKSGSRKLAPSALYTKDAILFPGDSIETGKDGQADLQFSKTVRLRIGPDSSLRIETARILAGKNFQQIQVRLNGGRVFSQLEKLDAGSRFTVVTPTSVAAVRGTEFLVREQRGKQETLVRNGSVEVADDTLSNLQIVEQDQKAEVSANGEVTVKPQTDSDKKECQDLGADIASITEQGRNDIQSLIEQFQEQKILIQQTLDEQKKSNEEIMQQQKDSNQELMQQKREQDRDLLRDQFQKDRQNMEELQNQMRSDMDASRDANKEEQNKITEQGRQDLDQMKHTSPSTSQDKTREELEKLRRGPQ